MLQQATSRLTFSSGMLTLLPRKHEVLIEKVKKWAKSGVIPGKEDVIEPEHTTKTFTFSPLKKWVEACRSVQFRRAFAKTYGRYGSGLDMLVEICTSTDTQHSEREACSLWTNSVDQSVCTQSALPVHSRVTGHEWCRQCNVVL